MTSTPDRAAALKSPPPATWRWGVLVAISLAMFGNYYVYDSVGPLADNLQRLLGFTDTQIGTLNAIYSFPNVVMVLVGGIIVDRVGTRLATLGFSVLCLVGALVTALSPWFPVMAAGRLLFGLGAESMIVAVTVAIGQWFFGRALGFAFGVNLSIARAGSYAADMSTTWAKPFYDAGWQQPLWLATALMGVGVAGAARTSASSAAPRAASTSTSHRRPTGSSGPTCGVSTGRTGTSSGCVSRSTRSSFPSAARSPSSTSSTRTGSRCRTRAR